jgi:hypothetical protein
MSNTGLGHNAEHSSPDVRHDVDGFEGNDQNLEKLGVVEMFLRSNLDSKSADEVIQEAKAE